MFCEIDIAQLREAQASSMQTSSNMAAGKHSPDLVSRVKEGQQPPLLHHLENTLPLLRGGVYPSGVVSTCMQEHH